VADRCHGLEAGSGEARPRPVRPYLLHEGQRLPKVLIRDPPHGFAVGDVAVQEPQYRAPYDRRIAGVDTASR
jgi:hypothetical protein